MEFVRAYQGFLIDHFDAKLLMTGLSKNISKLENDSSLTFLLRAPKLRLSALSLPAIAFSCQETFNITDKESYALAKATKVYAFAFQALGDILFRQNKKSLDTFVLKEYDTKLSDWNYEIIYSELTETERKIVSCIANGADSNQKLMKELNSSKCGLAIYKKKLIDEGLLISLARGKIEFALPRFAEFVQVHKALYEDKILSNNIFELNSFD